MIVVYFGEMPAEMHIARRHNLIVIDDCSHTDVATYKGQKVGTIGDPSCMQENSCLLAKVR